ncbi:glutamate receptor ionotropic, kainate 2 [Diachasma alloeum]|uniref:Ionotropic receptor 115 n=1 Tax=Diachasma alloeum TaxID=454923 RepID=A0A4E0RLG9_9HYME|nr:glutamate receptor ionotropic, kainate 2 [Diachasma alloeum]THK32979.1 ionotropic receptor 115 [Diachasma alloeum]
MELPVAVILSFITAYWSTLTTGHVHITYYGSLIDEFYKIHDADGILIVSSTNYHSFGSLTFWHEMSRKMSNRGRAADMVNFQELTPTLQLYRRQNVRPLFVIFIKNMKEVHFFGRITKTLNRSNSLWVILFSGDSSGDACEFCRHPEGNLFNLKFNSKVIVACCESTIIQEWWTSTGNRTHIGELGRWIDESRGIEWFSDKSLYERRTSLEGRPFHINIVQGSTDIWQKNGDLHGYLGRVVKALSQFMNFTISSVTIERSYGRWDPDASEWTGVLGKLHRNEVDMGVSSFIMTNERREVVDFTIPTVYENSRLYIRMPGANTVQWNAYFEAFGMDVWLVIIALIMTTPLLLTFIKYKGRSFIFPLVFEHYSSVWGIYCQQGLPEFPDETPLRIVFISLSLSALVITMAYSASLTSFLAVNVSHMPFTSIEEFVKLGTYKLIAIQDTADYTLFKDSDEVLMKKMAALMEPPGFLPATHHEGFQQVCRKSVAFHTTHEIREGYTSPFIPCKLAWIKTRKIQASGIIMPLNSEYTAFVNYHLQRFKYSGLLDRWKREYHYRIKDVPEIYHPSVQLKGITPILGVLTAGLLIALIILLIERIFHRHRDQLQRKKIRTSEVEMLQRMLSRPQSSPSWSRDSNDFRTIYRNRQKKLAQAWIINFE